MMESTDSLQTLCDATGVSRSSMLVLWEEVKANQAKLAACARHDFIALEPERRLGGKFRCTSCGGEADSHAVHWYRDGLRHAGGSHD